MKVYGLARLTKDIELQQIGNNKLIKTSIAWNDYKQEGHFHNIAVWNKTAELFSNIKKVIEYLLKVN